MQNSGTTQKVVSNGKAAESRRALGPHRRPASRWLFLSGWLLMMPPLPVGTELPPLSEWSPIAVYESAEECESKGEEVRNAARRMITGDPNAAATTLAAAMGQIQATCVEDDSVEPPAKPESPAKPKSPANAEPAGSEE